MLAVPQPNGSVTALTAVKVSQFLSENALVYGGKLNTLDGFRQPITGASGLDGFMNASLMFNLIYARTVPYSTYGAGFAYLKDLQPIASVNVLDTHNTPTTSGFDNFFTNGAVLLWQVNLPTKYFDMPGHQGLSGTYSSGKYTDLQPTAYFNPTQGLTLVTSQQTGSYSFAYNFDQALWVSQDDPKRMWGLFGNLGIADNNPSPIRWFANVGISGSSPFRSRKLDSFGVGYSYIGLSSALKEALPRLLPLQDEQVVEMYYNIGVTPWCHITPDLQVLSPALQTANTALVLGLRAKIDF